MENIAIIPPMPAANADAAAEARRAKTRQYQATFKAKHPERVKAKKQKWHEQARDKEIARRKEIYQRARADPAYVERRRAESRAYNQAKREAARAAKMMERLTLPPVAGG